MSNIPGKYQEREQFFQEGDTPSEYDQKVVAIYTMGFTCRPIPHALSFRSGKLYLSHAARDSAEQDAKDVREASQGVVEFADLQEREALDNTGSDVLDINIIRLVKCPRRFLKLAQHEA